MSNSILKNVLQNQSFTLVDVMVKYLNGDVEVNEDAVRNVLESIALDNQVIVNVEFLTNVYNNDILFRRMVQKFTPSNDDKSDIELHYLGVKKAISTFKNLHKLTSLVTLEDYATFARCDNATIEALHNKALKASELANEIDQLENDDK